MFLKICEALEDFLSNEAIDKTERKERLKMVWDITHEMLNIRFKMTRNTLTALMKKLGESPEFRDYQVAPGEFIEGKSMIPIRVYKKVWCLDDDQPVVFYTLEPGLGDFSSPWAGIRKADEKIPYPGDWKKQMCQLPSRTRETLCRLHGAFSNAWDNSEEAWSVSSIRESDLLWIVRQHIFPRTYRMESIRFYLMLIEKGYEEVAENYVRMFSLMKHTTEKFLDELVRDFRKN